MRRIATSFATRKAIKKGKISADNLLYRHLYSEKQRDKIKRRLQNMAV